MSIWLRKEALPEKETEVMLWDAQEKRAKTVVVTRSSIIDSPRYTCWRPMPESPFSAYEGTRCAACNRHIGPDEDVTLICAAHVILVEVCATCDVSITRYEVVNE